MNPSLRPLLSIDYTPAPEPSSLFLFACGTLGLALRRRREEG
ncbi:MAG: PEP-CTERM sorting domain-containing protein [Verrucomicrobiales bacterium]